MARVVFFNVSTTGNIIPTLGLVSELVKRGEEVFYFESPAFREEIEAFGAKLIPYPSVPKYQSPEGAYRLLVAPVMTWYAKEYLSKLLDPVRRVKPDYIIHDSLCIWGSLIAQILNVPAVCSISTAAFNSKSFYRFPLIWRVGPRLAFDSRNGLLKFMSLEREIRKQYRVKKMSLLDTFTNPQKLNICFLPKELQPFSERFGTEYHFVGPCNPIRAIQHSFSMDQIPKGKLIYISFGTIHDPGLKFFKDCFEAFRNLNVHVLMLTKHDVKALGKVPKNFIVCPTGTVPQLEILKKTDLFITHAGGGGVREAAWLGVPMLAIPQTYEQELLARQVVKQGIGICMSQKFADGNSLRRGAKLLLADRNFKRNSLRIQRACRNSGGAQKAVDEIFKFIRQFD